MTAERPGGEGPSSRAPAAGAGGRRGVDRLLRVLQATVALWLLVSPVVLDGPSSVVAVKDVLAGGLLLAVTLAAARGGPARRVEGTLCLLLGGLLIVASVLVEFGAGAEAVARQWSEVVAGVLLVCLGAVRAQ